MSTRFQLPELVRLRAASMAAGRTHSDGGAADLAVRLYRVPTGLVRLQIGMATEGTPYLPVADRLTDRP